MSLESTHNVLYTRPIGEVLAAIREHPQLKGYLEPGAPPGYLLLKSRSNPDNFVRRCQDLGFAVHTM